MVGKNELNVEFTYLRQTKHLPKDRKAQFANYQNAAPRLRAGHGHFGATAMMMVPATASTAELQMAAKSSSWQPRVTATE